ncbi:hypothetical protein [Sphingobium aquiterrae]|uniref:hypothetical protein n=1 Tax=Sphingobium aquiterrae TaxID=2038656 RepID=UPI003018EC89
MRLGKMIEADPAARAGRWACDAVIRVIGTGERQMTGRVGSISEAGFIAECAEPVPAGAIVAVDLPNRGAVQAEARWLLGCRFGARFLR